MMRRSRGAAGGSTTRFCRGRLRRWPGQRRRCAAASGQAPARLAEPRQSAALTVDGRLAVREKRLPRHALRVGDPLLVRPGIAAGGVVFLDYRPLGMAQPLVNFGKLALILGLNAEMGNSGRAASGADGEIDTRVFEHPLGVIVL